MPDLQSNSNEYAMFLKSLAIFTQRKNIVEVGVAFGKTTAQLCEAAKFNNGFVHGFDCWSQHGLWNQWAPMSSKTDVENYLKNQGYNNFKLVEINTRLSDFNAALKENVAKIDFAFIDGCHSYIGVKTDFVSLLPYFTDDAIIAFHDTEFIDGVREFLLDLRTKYNDGTFDLINFPYGSADHNCGLAVIMYRKYPNKNKITEICGSPNKPDIIYQKEKDWYDSQIKAVNYEE